MESGFFLNDPKMEALTEIKKYRLSRRNGKLMNSVELVLKKKNPESRSFAKTFGCKYKEDRRKMMTEGATGKRPGYILLLCVYPGLTNREVLELH